MSAYERLARYYDLENADFTEDLEFWAMLAETYGDPILELGCGSGRVLLNLARRGYAITGIDNSPGMLARLKTRLAQTSTRHIATPPTIVQADMLSFKLEAAPPFHLALMPFNTFMHLLTLDEQLAALTAIRAHLAMGAALALDMPNPGEVYAAQEQGLTLEREFADGDRWVHQFSAMTLDRAMQLAHITWLYDSLGTDGFIQRTVVPLTLRHTFPGEMRLLLERCGFTLAHLYGAYDQTPFAEGAPRMLVIAEAV